jgi:hypothetical protein
MNILALIDELAETGTGNRTALLLDRVAFAFAVVMVLAAPHSIAATQTAWLIGMSAWAARQFFPQRRKLCVTAVGWALLAYFAFSVVSAVFSYEPIVSIDKLRGVAVFLIFFYVLNVVRNARSAHLLAFALIGSCMIGVAWTPVQKLIGRGVEVHGVDPVGPLGRLGVRDGDTLLRVDGRRIRRPESIVAALDAKPTVKVDVYRTDAPFSIELPGNLSRASGTPESFLGFATWQRSSNFRAAGFYGHYTTFAEVLQLIGALAFGLLVAAYMAGARRAFVIALAVCVGGIALALLLTVTRGSQLSFIISSGVIVLLGASRRAVLIAIAVAVPLSLVGLYVLQQQRQVGFFDQKDGSIQYRQMMWRDGMRLWSESPRHAVVGVGMDSIKTHWLEWGMYDKGHQPMGHFHSTPVQLLVERGLPTLLAWLAVVGIFAYSIFRAFRRSSDADWRTRGILLGCIGGAVVGFFAGGLVHYNLGDTEVAMVLFTLMGLSMRLAISRPENILNADSPLLTEIGESVSSSPDSSDTRTRS